MNEKKAAAFFNKDRAATYDKQRASLTPIKDALFLLARVALSDLPEEAHILCVGVGTGAELDELATANSKWRYTLVDPAPAMLEACRKRVDKLGITDRCVFHDGYLDTLPEGEPFDAATAILVSHFIKNTDERRDFFAGIAARLRPGGWLVNADLSADKKAPSYKGLFDVWQKAMQSSGMPVEEVERICSFKGVSILSARELEHLIEDSGFKGPSLFYQGGMIHAWRSQRKG